MKINDFDKYISSYLDGDLRPSDIEEFEDILRNNSDCKEKFNDYKKMLNELSNLDILKTSDNFLYKLTDRINNRVLKVPKQRKFIFGYDYVTISGIAATVGMLIFSLSIFTNSDSSALSKLDNLSSKNIQQKSDNISTTVNLIAEDDTSSESNEIVLPKIHLVGGKK